MKAVPFYGRYLSPIEIGGWSDFLFTRGGYVLVDRNDNDRCGHCSEVVFARPLPSDVKRFDMFISTTRVASLDMRGCFFGNSNSTMSTRVVYHKGEVHPVSVYS